MMDIEFRIAKLEAENKALRERLAQIEDRDGRKALPPKPVEQAVRVTKPAPVSGFAMPTDEELDRLADIVTARHPQFGDVSGQAFYGSAKNAKRTGGANIRPRFSHSARSSGSNSRTTRSTCPTT